MRAVTEAGSDDFRDLLGGFPPLRMPRGGGTQLVKGLVQAQARAEESARRAPYEAWRGEKRGRWGRRDGNAGVGRGHRRWRAGREWGGAGRGGGLLRMGRERLRAGWGAYSRSALALGCTHPAPGARHVLGERDAPAAAVLGRSCGEEDGPSRDWTEGKDAGDARGCPGGERGWGLHWGAAAREGGGERGGKRERGRISFS